METTTEERPDRADQFQTFHTDNPHVYATLVRLARQYRRETGRDKCGMSLLIGRARWELAIDTTDVEPTLNNNHASFYARLIMATEPDLSAFFNVRRSTADAWDMTNVQGRRP